MQSLPKLRNDLVRRRTLAAGLALASGFAGLACKYYHGPAAGWVNNWGPASVAYELFFVFACFFLWPYRAAAPRIAVGVFVATCLVEILQLWHPAWLDTIRTTFIGKSVLGNSFSWWDFPAYLVGSAAGWGCLVWLAPWSDVPTDATAGE